MGLRVLEWEGDERGMKVVVGWGFCFGLGMVSWSREFWMGRYVFVYEVGA